MCVFAKLRSVVFRYDAERALACLQDTLTLPKKPLLESNNYLFCDTRTFQKQSCTNHWQKLKMIFVQQGGQLAPAQASDADSIIPPKSHEFSAGEILAHGDQYFKIFRIELLNSIPFRSINSYKLLWYHHKLKFCGLLGLVSAPPAPVPPCHASCSPSPPVRFSISIK